MNDKNTYKVEAKYNYGEGILELNIPEIIAELDEDDRESLAQLHAFDSVMWETIKKAVKGEYTTSSYNSNSNIHKLRIELLTGEGADEVLKKTVRGILIDMETAKRNAKHYRDNYFRIRRWLLDNTSHDQRQSMPEEIEWDDFPCIRDADVDKAIAETQVE